MRLAGRVSPVPFILMLSLSYKVFALLIPILQQTVIACLAGCWLQLWGSLWRGTWLRGASWLFCKVLLPSGPELMWL